MSAASVGASNDRLGGAHTRRPRLLAVGPALDQSSYCRVLESTLQHLGDWEIDQLGINHRGAPPAPERVQEKWEPVFRPEARRNKSWRIHPNPRVADPCGIEETAALARAIAPDVVFVFSSFLGLPRYWELPARLGKERPRLVAQCPLLGEATDPRLVGRLAFFDCVAVLSAGVKRHFEACLETCRREGFIDRVPHIAVVPHGLDSTVFRALGGDDDRRDLKRALFGAEASFIVLNVNRHEARKRIDLTLHGFARFARGKPAGVRLHLHMADGAGALRRLADALGIGARVTIASANGHPTLDDAALNRLYNACDVGINTASAEGWGMASFEHAATGAAQIVPGHGVCAEIWQGRAEIVAAAPLSDHSARYTRQSLVSAEGVADALQRLYENPHYRRTVAERGRRHALQPAFRWSEIGRRLSSLLALDRPASAA